MSCIGCRNDVVVAGTCWMMMVCVVIIVRGNFMLVVVMGQTRIWRFGIAMIALNTWMNVMLR